MPEKLPITAIVGIIAAALQATGALSGFWTVLTWSLVILAAAIEAALGYAASTHPSSRKRWTARVAILVAMIVVGFLNLHAHQTEHSKEDVRVNFHFPHPNQLGSEDLTLNFLIVNKAISSIVLVETLAVEIASTDFSNNTARDSAFCNAVLGRRSVGNGEFGASRPEGAPSYDAKARALFDRG